MRLEGTEVPQEYKALSVRDSPLRLCTHPLGNGKGKSAIGMYFHHASYLQCPLAMLFEQGEETHPVLSDHDWRLIQPKPSFSGKP